MESETSVPLCCLERGRPSPSNPTALPQPSPIATAPHHPSELTSEDHGVPPAAKPPRAPNSLAAASAAAGSWHRRPAQHRPRPRPRPAPPRPVPLLGDCPTASVVIGACGRNEKQTCTAILSACKTISVEKRFLGIAESRRRLRLVHFPPRQLHILHSAVNPSFSYCFCAIICQIQSMYGVVP